MVMACASIKVNINNTFLYCLDKLFFINALKHKNIVGMIILRVYFCYGCHISVYI